MEELFDVYKMIYNLSDMDEWKFLSTWESLSDKEKLIKYDKMCCHEFNLFIYFKDQNFFQGVVKPFISNKKEKNLIDYFMLE